MGYEFKVIKTANEIEDINMSYGICKILDDNEVEYTLRDNKSMYSIYTDKFDFGDLIFQEIDVEDTWNFSSSANLSEKKGYINGNIGDLGLNKFIGENLSDILNYFLTGNPKKYKSTKSVSIGNNFYGCGTRANTNPRSLTVNPINKYLSMLGWIYSCSYCFKNKKSEITVMLKPYNTDEIKRPFNFSYINKETEEKKIKVKFDKESEINLMARLYLETLMKYKMLSNEYSGLIFMQNILAGNKPLADKTTNIKLYNISIKYTEDLLKKLTYNMYSEDIKDITAKYILDLQRYNSFSKLVRVYAKEKNTFIDSDFKEEILNMYNEKIKSIYNNEVVNKLGKGFGRLLRDKKGFDIQVKLYNVANEKHLFRALRCLIDSYSRNYIFNNKNVSIINDEELIKLTQLINDKNDAKICVDALLSLGKLFITKKEN